MKKIILIILFSVFLTCECLAQVTTPGLARKFRGAATLPATCQANDVYVDTDASTGSRIYLCESANTWVAQGGTLGNCTGGPCFDGTSDGGTSLTFYDVGGNGIFSYSSAGFAVDKALSATSYSSTGSGQSSINQGLVVNESGGATAYDAFRVETDTLNAILTTPTGDIVTILGNWDASGAKFELPNSTSCTAGDCDAAGEAGRVCIDTDAASGSQWYVCEGAAGWIVQGGAGGSESTTVADTNSINMTLTGTEVKGDVIGSGINWTDVFNFNPGAINWTDFQNEPSSAINWTDIPLQVSNINWGAIEEIQSGDLNWTSIEVLAPIADTMIGDMDSSGACAAGTVCGGGHTHGATEITEADPLVNTSAEITAILDISGTMTDENLCSYESTGTRLDCDLAVNAGTDLTADLEEEVTWGAGLTISTQTAATASGEADFIKSGALTCGASTQGKAQVHTTPLQYCDNAATPTLQYAAYGNSTGVATSATALAADPADCATSTHFAVGVAASGAATCEAIGDADIPDSVTVTGWVLGTSSATTFTSPTLLTDLIDGVGAVDMDYGSADITDHTFTTDGGTVILDGSVVTDFFSSDVADPADAGIVRLGNAETICWEASPAGTDVCMSVDSSEIIQLTGGTFDGADATDGSIGASDLGTDSVSADELNATGVESELETALDIGGEVTSTGMASAVIADSVAVTNWNLTTPTVTGDITYAGTQPIFSIWLGANSAIFPTSGYAEVQDFAGTNFTYRVIAFDSATSEKAYWQFPLPDNITGATCTFQTYWTNKSGLTTQTFTLEIDTAGVANDAVFDSAALGGTVTDVTDTWLAQNDMHISAATSVTTDWTAGDFAIVYANRDVVTDNMTGDVLLFGVKVECSKATESE